MEEFDKFAKRIEKELAHRKKELSELSILVKGNMSDSEKNALRRATFPIIYSHWEGFVKRLGKEALSYIKNQKLSYIELQKTFSTIAIYQLMKGGLPTVEVKQTRMLMNFFAGDFTEVLNGNFDFGQTETWVDTQSNLKQEPLENILRLFCIKHNAESVSSGWLDNFVNTRNSISHGDLLQISENDFEDAFDRILKLLDLLKDCFFNYIENEGYKVANT